MCGFGCGGANNQMGTQEAGKKKYNKRKRENICGCYDHGEEEEEISSG